MNKEALHNKNTDNEKYLNTEPIDSRTDAGKGFAKPMDNRTDYEKDIVYKGWDGKEFATMEEVMQYNQMFYDNYKINLEEKKMRR